MRVTYGAGLYLLMRDSLAQFSVNEAVHAVV
jgi:hypothetical protein